MVSETLRENLSLYTMLIYDTSLIKIHLLLIHRIEEIFQLDLFHFLVEEILFLLCLKFLYRIRSIILESIIKNKYV